MNIHPYLLAGCFMLLGACQHSTKPHAGITDTALYMRIGHPDTALAIFLYKECYNYQFDDQREEYMRYESEYDVISKLYATLWSQRPDYRARYKQLEANQAQFLRDARNEIHACYRSFRVISDEMVYTYLLDKKDEELKRLLMKIAADTSAPDEERINAVETLEDWR